MTFVSFYFILLHSILFHSYFIPISHITTFFFDRRVFFFSPSLSCLVFITRRSRVCEVQLHGDKTFTLRQQKYKVSEILKTGEATVLFGTYNQNILEY